MHAGPDPVCDTHHCSVFIDAADCSSSVCLFGWRVFFVKGEHSVPIHLSSLTAQPGGLSMVKMSLDPVQVMSGQVQDLKVSPSSNGESRGSWEEKEFDRDQLDLTTKPKPVSIRLSWRRTPSDLD